MGFAIKLLTIVDFCFRTSSNQRTSHGYGAALPFHLQSPQTIEESPCAAYTIDMARFWVPSNRQYCGAHNHSKKGLSEAYSSLYQETLSWILWGAMHHIKHSRSADDQQKLESTTSWQGAWQLLFQCCFVTNSRITPKFLLLACPTDE